ncbi:MAG: hypothetical protein WJU30_00249 [Candidatus Phytoplasma pruni]
MAFILNQINQKFLSGSLFSFKKMPIVDAQLWVFWHFPLFVLMFLFSFKYALTFLLIYLFIDVAFYSSFQYLQIYNTYQTLFVDKSAVIVMKNIIFGAFIPILAYLFLSFLKMDEKNYQKMLLVFTIIIIIQSISRTINGYVWLTIIKKNLSTREGLFVNLIKAFFNGGTTKSWFMLWFLNLIPMITSNVINLVVFLLFRIKIQTFYQQFNFNEKHS